MKRLLYLSLLILIAGCTSQKTITKRDLRKDVRLQTTMGTMVLRLSDLTPKHRDNFLKLVKTKYYDGLLFHRVIQNFVIQGGDPDSRYAPAGKPLGDGGPAYTVPAEFNAALFHKRGALGAARDGDDINPQKASSASQFYIVQGKIWTNESLDTLEVKRLQSRKIPAAYREVYTTIGGVPHLDQNYTIFGEVVQGTNVLDSIASVATSKGADKDRPLKDVRILNARLIKRK